MHAKDFELLSRALAREHSAAAERGPRQGVVQAERAALAVAEAITREYRTFDPVKFLLAACEATELGQLSAQVRGEAVDRIGATELRPRLRSEHPGLYPDELIDTSRWTERSLIGATVGTVSSSHGVSMAVSALIDGGVGRLGQLVAMSDEELRAVPRIGPVAMEAIRKVKELWAAKRQQTPEVILVEPSNALQAHRAELDARAVQLGFPEGSAPAGRGRATGTARRRPAAGCEVHRNGTAPQALAAWDRPGQEKRNRYPQPPPQARQVPPKAR